jgi:hypothetical protein
MRQSFARPPFHHMGAIQMTLTAQSQHELLKQTTKIAVVLTK